ncbi:MAG: four helix bundle protein [Candidatus Omnitrophica bacterium]|nr:four helix bundle protein [Candidatus Omnitrophota bacterium]
MQNELPERLLNFAVEVIKLGIHLNKNATGRYINGQLIRAATSAGANYEETCGAESKADFIHKIQIVLKELRETCYWLKLIQRSKIVPESNLETLVQETRELTNIIAKSVLTAKKNR